jgi:hypothetical protein
MRQVVSLLLLCSILCGTTAAQQPYPNRYPRLDPLRELYRDLLLSEASRNQIGRQREVSELREAQYKEEQFILKAKKVVDFWNALTREYSERGTFNVKTAKEVSNAFRDLEKTEGWPRTHHK